MSKRILQHPEIPASESTRSWLNVGHLENSAAFKQSLTREFITTATRMENEEDAENSRRTFMKLMGASAMLGGLAACRRPEKYTIPYNQAPEWIIPGKALYYATAMPSAAGAIPLVVTSFEGRPTKLAPNHLHPDADGTDAFVQASILDLYAPSRSRVILHHGKPSDIAALEKTLADLSKTGKLAVVFGVDESPTRARLVKELTSKIAGFKPYAYEPLSAAHSSRAAVDFKKADRILALDCDFCALDRQGPVAPFFERRKPEGKGYKVAADAKSMNRLYAVESLFTLTGGMADHRLRVAPSQVENIAAYILSKLGGSVAGSTAITDSKHIDWLDHMVADLKENKGRSVVVAGSRTSSSLQSIVSAINTALGAYGSTLTGFASENATYGDLAALKTDIESGVIENVIFLTPANPVYDAPADFRFSEVVAKAKTSIHLGLRTDATAHACTWHVPAAHYLEAWADARSIRGTYTLVQPMILPLYDACVSELELISALLDGKIITGDDSSGYAAVRKTFTCGEVEWKQALRVGYCDGLASKPASPTETTSFAIKSAAIPTKDSLDVIFSTDGSIYDGRFIDNAWLQESPDPISKIAWDNAAFIAPKTAKELGIYDQVIALENQRAAAPVDGESGNRRAPLIAVTVNGVTVEIPVHIAFGLAENTVVLPLGYGQGYNTDNDFGREPQNESHVGQVGVNTGVNIYPLRTSSSTYMVQGGKVTKTEKRYFLAYTQEHHAMYGRALAREISTAKIEDKGDFAKQYDGVTLQGNDSHAPPNYSLYKQEGSSTWDPDKEGKAKPLLSDTLHQWAMNIDLSSCMGCNACLVACQAENNIPVVGKQQLAKGRAMHWIRMDRYFAQQKGNDFDIDSPSMVPQPVACVQCESAPCETVCPVNATVHTEDGLNAMAYNRCIGTRYCANNCPYKARRFNYFDYNKRNPLIAHNLYKGPFGETQIGKGPHLQRNPNVTVRMRGVMEKCTYCVQRLKDAQIRQKRGQKQEVLASGKTSPEVTVTTETLRVPVDTIKVACQEACPADAITFGNKLDGSASAIGRARDLKRSYELLHYIGTVPRTLYMARVKNPNPAMPDAAFIGRSTINMH